jgi:AraC-like DNA-binding protein
VVVVGARRGRLPAESGVCFYTETRQGRSLDEARWLLVNGDDIMTSLAQTVGYTSDDTFRRAFERRYGIAPAEYRRRFRMASA